LELPENWQTLFDADPPLKLRWSVLISGIAYRLRERALGGGLKSATVRLLERIAVDAAGRRQAAPIAEKNRVSDGTILIRAAVSTGVSDRNFAFIEVSPGNYDDLLTQWI
jgi:2-polyprenyl-6-methoxyphenol hydroxylase-like FAD-dependent oxidoreductase